MLAALLDSAGMTLEPIARNLETLSEVERRNQCLVLEAAQLSRLWQLAEAAPVAAGELLGGAEAVTFEGRNSLAALSRFEKRFVRMGGSIVGYNVHPLRFLIGPGYFTVVDAAGGELAFDYSRVPTAVPTGWPKVRGNSGFLARPVYGDLLDRVRWIGSDVLIGAAYRRGQPLHSYFVLVRATS